MKQNIELEKGVDGVYDSISALECGVDFLEDISGNDRHFEQGIKEKMADIVRPTQKARIEFVRLGIELAN